MRATGQRQPGSILAREIASQPQVLQTILERESARALRLGAAIARRPPSFITIVGRGSADNAGIYGKYLFGVRNGLVVALAAPSVVTRYHRPPRFADSLVLAISQSGESHDVVELVEAARAQGALTVAITNAVRSPLARAADEILLCHAGEERSVAATKTYTAQLALLALLSSAIAGDHSRVRALARIPEAMAEALRAETGTLAVRLRYLERCAVIARGYCYGTAFEAALKLEELTYLVAQPYSAADFRHGPIAVVDPGFCVLVFAPSGEVSADLEALLDELRRRGAETIVISDRARLRRLGTCGVELPRGVPEWLAPITAIAPAQLLAMQLASVKGLPLDRPRGLRKITRTR
jgi:glucosamine--fructose-6-phosphate aminotransferase (isomerizing)